MTDIAQQARDLFGLSLSAEQVAAFEAYTNELLDWNTRMNLTAITDRDAVMVRHFLDSLSVAKAVAPPPGTKMLDIGTGAGFPGLALHIASKGLHTTLLEATGKKIRFLEHVVQTLALRGVRTLHARAEDAAQSPVHREQYDLVLARAVARLPALLEYMLPFAKVGGLCVAMKGATAQTEAADSQKALQTLGGTLRGIEEVALPGVEDRHYLVVVEKTARTPKAYPRKPGTPTREPIS